MSSIWNTTNQSLPAVRDCVQFIVAGHKAWLLGTFQGDCFRSRWATYMPWEVSFWRRLEDDAPLSSQWRAADKQYWSERRVRGDSP